MRPEQHTHSNQCFLFDADVLVADQVRPELFSVEEHENQQTLLGQGMGRAAVQFVAIAGRECALRHFRRGGLMRHVVQDRYWWLGLNRTRAWQEWHLLRQLRQQQLPVPAPVAARVVRHGLWYSADLLTEKIPGSRPLSLVLADNETLDPAFLANPSEAKTLWRRVGHVVAQFHRAGVYHADLNAHNILLDPSGQVYLIDFDKGRFRSGASGWQQENLQRLLRSLRKLKNQHAQFGFSDADWEQLLQGYQSCLGMQ
ncbi:MAG: 3-deoxy-D-manno-octulosonic acid kinase [Gammaproteobacteria bacterium]|nr:3-deoxy-D-manno-octulosonic acid kinase [Gammaproteobacteria bacterium]MDH5801761.1 3-deoxy-D-manno-octulosonic acid kinase [Gammaproteobacteria bacterium]